MSAGNVNHVALDVALMSCPGNPDDEMDRAGPAAGMTERRMELRCVR
jgi:hypothetical protein